MPLRETAVQPHGLRTWPAAALLAACVAAIYLAWVGNGFNYDDRVEFIRVQAPRTVAEAAALFGQPSYPTLPYYRPVVKASLLLQKTWWGLQPAPYHVANAVFAAAAALAAYLVFSAPAFRLPRLLALLAAAVFALHPVASSCVYPASGGRYSLLVAVFMTGALAGFLRGGRSGRLVAWLLFALALLSKEQAIVLLPLFAVVDLLGLSVDPPGRSGRRWAMRYLVPCAIVGAYLVTRSMVFRGVDFHLSFFARPAVVWLTPLYAWQVALAPSWELVYEPMRAATWFSPGRLGVGIVLALALGWALWRRERESREGRRAAAFWFAWFTFGLLPSANILSQEVAYDERYTFVSLLGVVGLFATAVAPWWRHAAGRKTIAFAGAAAVLALTSVTLHRGRYFRDDLVFTTQWVRTSPEEYLPHYSRGVALAEVGKKDEAMSEYRRALALNPAWPDAHLNLGVLRLERGEFQAARHLFLEYARLKPASAKAHYSVGVASLHLGDSDEARRCFERALALQPAYPEAHHNLGVALDQLGRWPEAIAHYEAALRLDPAKRSTRENLAGLRARLAAPR